MSDWSRGVLTALLALPIASMMFDSLAVAVAFAIPTGVIAALFFGPARPATDEA
ncbi:hypothetical protein RDV89_19615 [Nocardioides zeae]|uniref:Uncharacterized protein n=1 Tax=Nocardioides imazamoxiresistens TaxID=3231893 RepID=A0ABU3Q2K6_9ACTN|nr:hypothetical protein [Nocardioides zeae]MDT9595305.1 hypothetical protein [Nocardioides zeae]